MINTATLRLRATDPGERNPVQLSDVSIDLTVGELLDSLVESMHLPRHDRSGRPLEYQARLDREGRHLHRSERVAVLEQDDELVLHPSVDAGR
ncbi:MAG TPA: hypothetical protein VGO11_12270 [Chthoniobacteraceae bacterium]|jgi:hypothetical protein|nr:hypothetical protein [Chthoniobacteraceae bacterium]